MWRANKNGCFFRRARNARTTPMLRLGGAGGVAPPLFRAILVAAVFFADPGTNISRSISKGAAFCLYREWATACGSWRRWCWRVDGEGSTEGMSGCGCVGAGGGRAYLLELSWQRAATRGRYGQVGCGCALATLGSPEATQLAHLRSPHVLLTFAARSPHVLHTFSSRSPPGNKAFSEV